MSWSAEALLAVARMGTNTQLQVSVKPDVAFDQLCEVACLHSSATSSNIANMNLEQATHFAYELATALWH
jgi:hypothetical protein